MVLESFVGVSAFHRLISITVLGHSQRMNGVPPSNGFVVVTHVYPQQGAQSGVSPQTASAPPFNSPLEKFLKGEPAVLGVGYVHHCHFYFVSDAGYAQLPYLRNSGMLSNIYMTRSFKLAYSILQNRYMLIHKHAFFQNLFQNA